MHFATFPSLPVLMVDDEEHLLKVIKILDEYKENEVKADMKYKGKMFVVVGVVRDIFKFDKLGLFSITVSLSFGSYQVKDKNVTYNLGFRCKFTKEDEKVISNLVKGQAIVVVGIFDEIVYSFDRLREISLEHCVISEYKPNTYKKKSH